MIANRQKLIAVTLAGGVVVSIVTFALYALGRPRTLTIDFSTTHFASQVLVSRKVKWVFDVVDWDDVDLDIRFPGNRAYKGHVATIFFDRDGNSVESVTILLDHASLSDVRAQALRLASEWNLPSGSIERWYTQASGGRSDRFYLLDNSPTPKVDLEIDSTMLPDKPAYISLELSWPSESVMKALASRPSQSR